MTSPGLNVFIGALLLACTAGCATPAAWSQSQAGAEAQTSASADTDAATTDPESMVPHFKSTRFWLSGQANFIFQTHPDFHADYSGPNSLSPHYEKATSRVLTLYTGVRLGNSTELLVDIEEAGV